jgi:hypothetical protein
MTSRNVKPRYRVVPALSGSLAPSRAFEDAAAAREWAGLMARRYGVQMDLFDVNPATGRGPMLDSFEPKR